MTNIHVRLTGPRVLFRQAVARGFDVESYLVQIGLDPRRARNDPEYSIPTKLISKIWAEIPELSGDPLLHLHAAENVCFDYPISEHLIRVSDDIRQSYKIAKFGMISTPVLKLEFNELPDGSGIYEVSPRDKGFGFPPQYFEYTLALSYFLRRRYSSEQWHPTKIELMDRPDSEDQERKRIWGCPIHFGTEANRLFISKDALSIKINESDPTLFSLLSRLATHELDQLHANPPFKINEERLEDRVRIVLEEALPRHEAQSEKIAKRLGMSSKTLQRKLKEEGTSFQKVLDQLRQNLAETLLKQRDEISLEGISFMLGYSELSAFYKAYHRWTGKRLSARTA